jgi:hypothetical protein
MYIPKATSPFSGTTAQTINFNKSLSGLYFSNDGSSDMSLTINSDIFTVKSGEVFDDYTNAFTSITVTLGTYHGYGRG